MWASQSVDASQVRWSEEHLRRQNALLGATLRGTQQGQTGPQVYHGRVEDVGVLQPRGERIYAVRFNGHELRLLTEEQVYRLDPQMTDPQVSRPPGQATYADVARAPAADTQKRKWEFEDARMVLLRYLAGLSLERLADADAAPGGYEWPQLSDNKIPRFFESLNQQLRLFAAPMLDDARASVQQAFQTMSVNSSWRVKMLPRGLCKQDRDRLLRALPDRRIDDRCRYFSINVFEGENRSTKNSWLPYSTVLLVQLPIPPDKKALASTPHRFGLLHRTHEGGYIVQVIDHAREWCPMCISDFDDSRTTVSCACRSTRLHSCCAHYAASSPGFDSDNVLTCEKCMEMVEEPRQNCSTEYVNWGMFVMDSLMAPLRQAAVLENPLDHLPCFWSKDISGNQYGQEMDPDEILPPVSMGQRRMKGKVRRGPIASVEDLERQDSTTNQPLRDLNHSQRRACTEALSLDSGVVLVQGPPGTGKTKTISSLILACVANGQRVLTCGPTNVAAIEIANRTWQMVQSGALGPFRKAQICIVASEDRVGIPMDHQLSELMLDHRKKRVKRVAKAGLRELVPMLRDILDSPRKVFQNWIKWASSGHDADTWSAIPARVAQTKRPYRELVERLSRGETFRAPAPESIPEDTDEAFRTFLSTQAFEAVEDILLWQQDHLTSSLPQLPQHVDLAESPDDDQECKLKLQNQLQDFQRAMEQVRAVVKAMRTALQMGQTPTADETGAPWDHIDAAKPLERAVKEWAVKCDEVANTNSDEIRNHILEGAQVIFSTTTVAGRTKVWTQKIPTVIVDEACQCRELETMVVMRRHVQRLILVGDPEQLPSTVFSKKAKEIGFDRSLFERLVEIGKQKHTLARQYRMLPMIADFPNSAFYDSQVVNDDIVKIMDQRIQDYIYAPDEKWNFQTAIRLYDTGNHELEERDLVNLSISNTREAELIVKLLHNFFQKNETEQRLSVGIITPYLGQVRLIKDMIGGPRSTVQGRKLEKKVKLVKTVDGFQGNEQDIIIISTVRSNKKGNIGFVSDKRRLNVAITRARLRLWIIGDLQTLQTGDETWRSFINFCKVRKLVQAVPDNRTQAERNVEKVVTQASGGGWASGGHGGQPGSSTASARPSAANARVAMSQAFSLAGAQDDGTMWNSFFLQQLVTMISMIKEEIHRRAVVKKITQILRGDAVVWKPDHVRDGSNLTLWQKVVEETPIGNAWLVWWVEIDSHGIQVVIFADLVNGDRINQARIRASNYLRTFSDECLTRCLERQVEDDKVVPKHFTDIFDRRRQQPGGEGEVLEPDSSDAKDGLPVSLEKRYVMRKHELEFLVRHTLRHVQLPYSLDHDEEIAYEKAATEVVFLLGRSGSGKTSVLVHALFRAACQERQRQSDGGPDDEALLSLLVTRSPVLADSIRKLFAQMQAGPGGGSGESTKALEDLSGIELGVVKEEERRQFRPPPKSLEETEFDPSESPVITSWQSLLLMLDKSIRGEAFFRQVDPGSSRVTRALQRQGQRGRGSRDVRGEDRFESAAPEEGRFDMERDHLTYEEFEEKCGPKLWKAGCLSASDGDSLFGAYREFLTVIAGSPRAARSANGCLSKEEYVSGKGPDGKSLPEIKESGFKNTEQGRARIYTAFEVYKKFKQEFHRYDCTDVARDLLKRAERFGLKQIRMFFGVYIDEVQDLLPVELLLLKLISERPDGFIFAGDTAQTISKGVEFRFDSIRRLFFEEFCGGREPEAELVQVKVEKCSFCQNEMRKGGQHYVCHGKYHEWYVCKDDKCNKEFEKRCKALKTATGTGLKRRLDNSSGKLCCPYFAQTGACGLGLTPQNVPPATVQDIQPDLQHNVSGQMTQLAQVPRITCLSQNHRSTNSILELAASILDLIMHFFPDKLDQLPKETSRVKSSTPPVILNRMSWEEAQAIIFARESSENAVLEFGAKQVVLVWSEEKKREMKQKLTQSLVMTINECKGLEFFDVLLVDPFSDMSSSTNESQATQNWNLIYGVFEKFQLEVSASEKKRASTLIEDKHGLLCSWLKTLYVGITRARKRVWILESQDSGQALVGFLKGLGVAQVCKVGDAQAVQGFADTSSAQEWFDQGLRMFRDIGNFDQAKLCFSNAEASGLPQGAPWRLLSEAEEHKKPGKTNYREAGAAYVKLAEWLETALGAKDRHLQNAAQEVGVEEKNLRPKEARQRAAESFLEVEDFAQAGREFASAGCFKDAAECAEVRGKWEEAGDLWRKAGEDLLALKSFQRGEVWAKFVEMAQTLGKDQKLPPEVMDSVVLACRDLAKKLQKQSQQKQQKDTNMFKALKQCISLLPPEEEQELLLQQLDWQELTLEVYQTQKRYDQCAAIALEMCDWTKARQYYSQAKDANEANWLELVEALWKLLHGGVVPAAAVAKMKEDGPQRLFSEDDLKRLAKVEDTKGPSKKEGVKRKHIVQTLRQLQAAFTSPTSKERGPMLKDAYASAMQLKESSPGYALRLSSFTLMAMAKNFVHQRGGDLCQQFEQICEGFVQCLKEIRTMRSTWGRRTRHNYRDNRRGGGTGEKTLSEWLLAEQPARVKPNFLLLSDCQPQRGEGRKVNLAEMSELATHWSHVFEASLSCHLLELCKVVAENQLLCWSQAAGYKCDRIKSQHEMQMMSPESRKENPGCQWLHKEPDAALVTSVCRRLLKASTSSSQILQGKELKDTLQLYGEMAMEALGGADRWKKLSLMPEQSIDLMMARLKALAPESPSRSLEAELNDEELHELAYEASRTKLDSMVKQKRPPELQEAFSVLEALPFLRPEDRQTERLKLLSLQSLFQRQDATLNITTKKDNPVKMVLQAEKEEKVFSYLRLQWWVQTRLSDYWHTPKDRKDKFYSLKPASVFHVLEKVVVWASVCLTQFDNLYLPQSFVQAHLTGAQNLARQAALATKETADVWKREARDALNQVAKFLSKLMWWDFDFFAWMDKSKAHSGEVMARIASLLIATVLNDQQVTQDVTKIWIDVRPEKKLDIMRTIEERDGSSLPLPMLRLLLFLPKEQDKLLKCASAAMQRSHDPLICLWRHGWSKENRRLLRGGNFTLWRLPWKLEEVIKKKVRREEVKGALLNKFCFKWPRMRDIQVDRAEDESMLWDPAAMLRAAKASKRKVEESHEAEADPGAEDVPEEPEEEQDAGAEPVEPESTDGPSASDGPGAATGPSGVVEETKLSIEDCVKIVEEKLKKTTLRTIWSTWTDVVQEATREVSAEERAHLEALQALGDLKDLDAKQRIRYRALVLPVKRRYAEEQTRLRELQKELREIDVGKLQKDDEPVVKGAKRTTETADEIVSKAQTNVQKLLKLSEDFLKAEVTPNFLGQEAEKKVADLYSMRRLITGIGMMKTPKTRKPKPVFVKSDKCLPALLETLHLEHFLYPTWICEQLKRRLARLRKETVNFEGAPILCGARRLWDSRARTFTIEEAVKLCKEAEAKEAAPKGEVAGNMQEEQIPEETKEQIAEETKEQIAEKTQDGSGQPQETLIEETLQELPPQHDLTPEVQPQQLETAEKKGDLPVAALPQEAEEQVEKAQQEEAPSKKPEDEEEQSGTTTEEPATAQLENPAEQVEKTQEPVPTEAETAPQQTTSDQLQEAVEVKQEEPAPQCLAEEEEKPPEMILPEQILPEQSTAQDLVVQTGDPSEKPPTSPATMVTPSTVVAGKLDDQSQASSPVNDTMSVNAQLEANDAVEKRPDGEPLLQDEGGAAAAAKNMDSADQKETLEEFVSEAEGGNVPKAEQVPEPAAPSPEELQAQLEEKQRKKASKFAKKRQLKKEVQIVETTPAESDEDPADVAKWCEEEKALRERAMSLCEKFGKSLGDLATKKKTSDPNAERSLLQKMQEKLEEAIEDWQSFCNCDEPGAKLEKNQKLWNRKRKGWFDELVECQYDLEWKINESKALDKISLMKSGMRDRTGAWAAHYGVEVIFSQHSDLMCCLEDYFGGEDGAAAPQLSKEDRASANCVLKIMDYVWKLVATAAKAWQVPGEESVSEEEEEEEEAEVAANEEVQEEGEGKVPEEVCCPLAGLDINKIFNAFGRGSKSLEDVRAEVLKFCAVWQEVGEVNEAQPGFAKLKDIMKADDLRNSVESAKTLEELRESEGYQTLHRLMSHLRKDVKQMQQQAKQQARAKKAKAKVKKQTEEPSVSEAKPSEDSAEQPSVSEAQPAEDSRAREVNQQGDDPASREAQLHQDGRKSTLATCPECKEQMEKGKMKSHRRKECIMRVVDCPDCDCRMSWKLLEDHKQNECENRAATCESCGMSTTYRKLQTHVAEECPEREVQCPYANAKNNKIQCYWKGKARRLPIHVAECCARPTAPRPSEAAAAPPPKAVQPKPLPKPVVQPVVQPLPKAKQVVVPGAGTWPFGQEQEAKDFAQKWGLDWQMVRLKLEGLSPPWRELIMTRFKNDPDHVAWGKFLKFVDSCNENGWWHCQSYEDWYAERHAKFAAEETRAKAAAKASPKPPPTLDGAMPVGAPIGANCMAKSPPVDGWRWLGEAKQHPESPTKKSPPMPKSWGPVGAPALSREQFPKKAPPAVPNVETVEQFPKKAPPAVPNVEAAEQFPKKAPPAVPNVETVEQFPQKAPPAVPNVEAVEQFPQKAPPAVPNVEAVELPKKAPPAAPDLPRKAPPAKRSMAFREEEGPAPFKAPPAVPPQEPLVRKAPPISIGQADVAQQLERQPQETLYKAPPKQAVIRKAPPVGPFQDEVIMAVPAKPPPPIPDDLRERRSQASALATGSQEAAPPQPDEVPIAKAPRVTRWNRASQPQIQ